MRKLKRRQPISFIRKVKGQVTNVPFSSTINVLSIYGLELLYVANGYVETGYFEELT